MTAQIHTFPSPPPRQLTENIHDWANIRTMLEIQQNSCAMKGQRLTVAHLCDLIDYVEQKINKLKAES